MFIKYQHVERIGHQENEGLLEGLCYIFYKIDGTNASIWLKSDIEGQPVALGFGSRNRELSLENDNAGFMNWGYKELKFYAFFSFNPSLVLYGEWLVPHSLKTYREGAWRDFYVFDVLDTTTGELLPYETYKALCDEYGINYIPPLAVIKFPKEQDLYRCLEKSGQYLVEDGKGEGEGIVIKNYDYKNRYGRQVWAKIVTNEFKEIHHKEMGAPEINNTILVEERIIDDYFSTAFIEKERAKLVNRDGEWNNKHIPELLGVCWYEFIREETWSFLKEHKMPSINFKFMQQLAIRKIKKTIGI